MQNRARLWRAVGAKVIEERRSVGTTFVQRIRPAFRLQTGNGCVVDVVVVDEFRYGAKGEGRRVVSWRTDVAVSGREGTSAVDRAVVTVGFETENEYIGNLSNVKTKSRFHFLYFRLIYNLTHRRMFTSKV